MNRKCGSSRKCYCVICMSANLVKFFKYQIFQATVLKQLPKSVRHGRHAYADKIKPIDAMVGVASVNKNSIRAKSDAVFHCIVYSCLF